VFFYAESGKWDEFIRLLEAQEAKEKEDAAKIGLLLKVAQLWMTRRASSIARRARTRRCSARSEPLAAAEALIPIYANTSNWKGLAGTIEVKLAHDGGDAAKLELYARSRRSNETKLNEPKKAFERYLAAFELAPGDARCVDDVERARARDRWLGGADRVVHTRDREAEEDGERDLGNRSAPASRTGAAR